MIQTRNQIEAHLDQARCELNSNLLELESRAVSALDWRQQFQSNPGTLLAVAFGGGIALSLLIGGGKRQRPRNGGSPAPHLNSPRSNSELWDKVKGALVGLAAARVTDYVGRLIPGSHGLQDQPVEYPPPTSRYS
jgi:hypothetical protein